MAARTIALLTPESAHYPSSNFAALTLLNQRPVLAYDASTEETAYWTAPAVQGITTPLTAVLTFCMASATSGAVVLGVQVEAISDGDSTDIDAGTSFDATNNSAGTTVPGTAGYIKQVSVTLTNNDGIAAGDLVRIAVARKTADAGDTATGDLYLIQVELRDDGA
jgi:hypothetical protein